MPLNADHVFQVVILFLREIQFLQSRRRRKIKFDQTKRVNSYNEIASTCTILKRIRSGLNFKILCLKALTLWLQANTFKRNHRVYGRLWWEKTVLTKFNTQQWRKYFRLSCANFKYLVKILEASLTSHNVYQNITNEKKVAMTLFFLSSGKNQTTVSKLFNVEVKEVTYCISLVCKLILNSLLSKCIKVPNEIEIIHYLDNFEQKWGFPHCAGILDCLHIPLDGKKLPENSGDYLNSDGGYSMYLQGVVDPTYKFWDINVGWPGSVTESKVFSSTTLWKKGQEGKLFPDWTRNINDVNVPIYILGNSSYPLTNWVLKPPQCNDGSSENSSKFYKKFTFARNVSEIAFKRLKSRWNCLVSGNMFNIDEFPTIIATCCVLHNFCEIIKEPINDEWIVRSEKMYHQPLPSSCNIILGSDAKNIQFALKHYFST